MTRRTIVQMFEHQPNLLSFGCLRDVRIKAWLGTERAFREWDERIFPA